MADTEARAAPAEDGAPVKKAYVPPHRRKQLEEEAKREAARAERGDDRRDDRGPDRRDDRGPKKVADRWAALDDRDDRRYDDRDRRYDDRDRRSGRYDDRDRGRYDDRDRGRYDDRDRGRYDDRDRGRYDDRDRGRYDDRDRGRYDDRDRGRYDDRDRRDRPVNDRWKGLDGSDDRDDGSRYGRSSARDGNKDWGTRDGRRPVHEDAADVWTQEAQGVSSGIKFDDYDKIPVEMSGNGVDDITPIKLFKDAEMQSALLANIERCNYRRPTPVQKHAIPTIMAGRDLMACAQTGSGKTAAFLFPCIQKMLKDGPPQPPANRRRRSLPVILCMAPTRELVSQIYDEARKFTFQSGMRAVCVYGGADIRMQMRELERGCDVLVATPGRLSDLIERAKVSLCCIHFLILDEADRMLDMGFEPQIRRIVEEEDMTPACDRQTCMFSATFPKEIQQLARDFLEDYIYLAVGRVGAANEKITQTMRYVDEYLKNKYLIKLLEEQTEEGLTLIFVETKRKAEELEYLLRSERFPATSIHGDRSQWEREEALKAFKSGECPILVATGVAARGLDISNVNHVINVDLPNNIDDYVHRIGRTGRAGNVGRATSFVNEGNRVVLRELHALLDEANQEIPAWFENLVSSSSSAMGGRFSRPKGGKKGGHNFGGNTDHREGHQRREFTTSGRDDAPVETWRSGRSSAPVKRSDPAVDNTAF